MNNYFIFFHCHRVLFINNVCFTKSDYFQLYNAISMVHLVDSRVQRETKWCNLIKIIAHNIIAILIAISNFVRVSRYVLLNTHNKSLSLTGSLRGCPRMGIVEILLYLSSLPFIHYIIQYIYIYIIYTKSPIETSKHRIKFDFYSLTHWEFGSKCTIYLYVVDV